MNRINTKMKLLALGLLGLGGFAVAGSAAAACPTTPSAWTESGAYQGTLSIQAGGLGGTACRMDASLQAGAGGFAFATVHDASPSAEPRYRAQFMIDLDSLSNPSLTTGAQILNVVSGTNGGGVQLYVFGSSNQWYVSYSVPDSTQPTGVRSGAAALAAGENHIEIDLQIGTSGSFTMWVNSNAEGSPTIAPTTVNNSSLVGIDDVYMGLAAASPGFVGTYAGTAVQFDQFDSRRQTFIGY